MLEACMFGISSSGLSAIYLDGQLHMGNLVIVHNCVQSPMTCVSRYSALCMYTIHVHIPCFGYNYAGIVKHPPKHCIYGSYGRNVLGNRSYVGCNVLQTHGTYIGKKDLNISLCHIWWIRTLEAYFDLSLHKNVQAIWYCYYSAKGDAWMITLLRFLADTASKRTHKHLHLNLIWVYVAQ